MALSMAISINGTVQRKIENIPWSSWMTAQNAMEAAYHSGTGYAVILQYFGQGLGYEVISNDNIACQFGATLACSGNSA